MADRDIRRSAHALRHRGRARWDECRRSPFVPAVVLFFILGAAAGLFAGSYCYALANPTPHRVPIAVVGTGGPVTAFLATMDKDLDASLIPTSYSSYDRARRAIDQQHRFAVITQSGPGVRLDLAGAAGASVSRVLRQTAVSAGRRSHTPVEVRDINPLQPTDPQGLAIFYISLAAVIIGFVGGWLPPGASVNAQHTAIYFPHDQHIEPFAALAAWSLCAAAVFLIWRHRHPGGRP